MPRAFCSPLSALLFNLLEYFGVFLLLPAYHNFRLSRQLQVHTIASNPVNVRSLYLT
jgi:hypothetical protein